MLKTTCLYLLAGFIIMCCCFSCAGKKTPTAVTTVINDSCKLKRDTTVTIQFDSDTTTTDFYKMLSFLEKKGEIYYKRAEIGLIENQQNVYLRRMLCPDDWKDDREERWILKGVFAISGKLRLKNAAEGKHDLFGSITVTQYNFTTEMEKQKAYDKIHEIGWGDPQRKWNEYLLASDKKRIYIIQADYAAAISFMRRYAGIIEKEWSDLKF